ncbi:MAG: class I SAM-dependent methyltransferase [Bacteroidales bacterium]|jgi:SAM-dependent methyltransferase|nr:class I SAM-dependent methyltransferase [Bacteroidales bacterium]
MDVNQFYQLLCNEIELTPGLYPYYKLNEGNESRRRWRKVYFTQRLEYINRHIDQFLSNPTILDCGCGYGSTCLFLAMNNIETEGITLEYYADLIAGRKSFWSQFGNSALFSYRYENLFDNPPAENSLDYIILQDTLHHIEPIDVGLSIFYNALKKNGKLILVEINGASLLESFIFFLKRGNKKIIEFYDEKLDKMITMGNEYFRSENHWKKMFADKGFTCEEDAIHYIRYFMPFSFRKNNENEIIRKEQHISLHYPLLKKYGFFGLNMVFTKK